MDEIAAARSMQWNTEFDKGLRSQKPGSQWEAILKLGLRLQQWSREPPVSAVTANLFKLNPGQDQAFANAVMFHLVEAFKSGNNFTRLYVLKILLLEKRSRKRGDRKGNYKGLLTKDRIPNHVEVLKRVKSVMDSGDMIARALTLRVLGCLADLARDSADVHRLVFEALNSPCQQEVYAGLYTVGCLCEISEPFSLLALERLIDFINAMETTPETRIRAIRIFSQMHLSASVSFKAYETGKGLMISIPTDEVVITTLEALSRLTFKASIILSDQVDLVLSYACSDPRSIVRAVSLKCLIRLASKATGWVGSKEKVFETMISILEDINQPFYVQTLAVQALRKLLPHCVIAIDASHFVRLFSVVELSAMHPDWPRRQPFLSLIVDLACNLENLRPDVCKAVDEQMGLGQFLLLGDTNSEVQPESADSEPKVRLDISTRISLLICDQVALLSCSMNSEEFEQRNAKVLITEPCDNELSALLRKRCRFLCELLLQLVQGYSGAGFVIVDCLVGMVEAVLKRFEQTAGSDQYHDTLDGIFLQRKTANLGLPLESELSAYRPFLLKTICLCLRGCVSILNSKEDYQSKIFRRFSDLISCCTVINASHHVLVHLLSLLLKIREYFIDWKESQEIDAKVHYMAKCFLKERDFWAAYKVCVCAACHGLWTEVRSVMDYIVDTAQSEGCHFWLKALAAVCTAEATIQSECQKKLNADIRTENSKKVLENIEMRETCLGTKGNLGDAIATALPSLQVAASSLAAAVNLDRTFEFQRWLLTLRIACLRSSGELLGLLGPVCLDLEGFNVQTINSSMTDTLTDDLCLKQTISSIYAAAKKSEALSLQFTKLAMELDILCLSFIGMDKESLSVISYMALGCSFLSFCTAFALSYHQAWGGGLGSNELGQSQVGNIANDLYQRLEGVGGDEWPELLLFSLQLGAVNLSPFISSGASCLPAAEKLLMLVRWAVRELLQLQDDANMIEPQHLWLVLARGLPLLKDIVEKWLCLPLILPKHFLCTRPRAGFEVFVGRMDNREMDDIVVTQGSFVPVSLCFQIRNLNVNGRTKVKRLSGALLLKKTDETHNFVDEEFYTGWRLGWCDNQTIGSESLSLMEVLLFDLKRGVSTSEASSPVVVCNVDEKGQAFSSCLLSTADLQCGAYCMSLQALCLDNEGHHWMLPQLNNSRTLRII